MSAGHRAALLLLAALAASSAPAAAQAPPVFGARVESVFVDVFVTQGGRSLLGLDASNFELKEDGVAQDVELVGLDTVPVQALLVFDTSGSVTGERLASLRQAGAAFLDGLRPRDEAGLIGFNEEIRWHARPTTDRDALRRSLAGLRGAGATAVRDALFAAITLPSTRSRVLVVLFTDGEDNMSWLGERELRTAAERANALVQVVGVRVAETVPRRSAERGSSYLAPAGAPEPVHVRALRQVAEATGGRYWEAESYERLARAFSAIVEAMNARYVLRYEPRVPRRAGWHRIEVRLKGARGDIHARRGYWVGRR